MSPSVVFWPGVGGGTEWYRCRAPGQALRRLGWDVSYVEGDQSSLDADVVVLQRVARPGTADLIAALQQHGKLVVYDIDDWYDNVPRYNPASDHVAPILSEVHAAMRQADLISCSTLELADGYARFGPTVVLENYLDPEVWTDVQTSPRSRVHVGWLGHFEYRSADLDLLKPWLPKWLAARPYVRFVACGSPETLDYLGVGGLVSPPTPQGHHVRPYDHLPYMLPALDIGLVPLAQNRFNSAKSWVKGLEYNAAGAAVVATPSREYRRYIRPGVNGLFARRTWGRQLDTIIDNLDAYRTNARKVADEHIIDRHIHRWVDAWQTAVGDRTYQSTEAP